MYLKFYLALALLSLRVWYPVTAQGFWPEDLDNGILQKMDEARKPGLSAAVVHNGELVWSGSYGFADIENRRPMEKDTPIMAASVSKTITACAVMQLAEQGFVDLDSDCSEYLPFPVRNPRYPDSPITVRMLMTHTSSIKSNWGRVMKGLLAEGEPEMSPADFCREYLSPEGSFYYRGNFADFEPGSGFAYSNPAVTLLACIVENVSGLDFESYCHNNIFNPIGMERTSWFDGNLSAEQAVYYKKNSSGGRWKRIEPYNAPFYPSLGLKTTAEDYAHFMLMIMADGETNGVQLLTPDSVAQLLEIQNDVEPAHWDAMGLIFQHKRLEERELVGHTGGLWGMASLAHFDRETGTGVVLFMNGGWMKFFRFDRLQEDPVREIYQTLFDLGDSFESVEDTVAEK